jgi:hypothetical protein
MLVHHNCVIQGQIAAAKAYFDNASPSELEQLKNNIIAG